MFRTSLPNRNALRRTLAKKVKSFIFLSGILFCAPSIAADDGKISISIKSSGFFSVKHNLVVENNDLVPRIVRLSIFNGRNEDELVQKKVFVIGAKSIIEEELVLLPGKKLALNYSWRYEWMRGIIPTQKKDNNFYIPFSESEVGVCQFFDGPLTTHQEKSYAIDFCAAEKTPIVAARGGQVLEVVDSFSEGGPRKELYEKYNYVKILHDDGMQTVYGHIYPKSANVAVGDRVESGQMIAQVGQVGYTFGPHLHFEALYPNEELSTIIVNPNFINDSGEPIKLTYGTRVSRSGIVEKAKVVPVSNPSPGPTPPREAVVAAARVEPPLSERALKCAELKGDFLAKANECLISRNYDEAIKLLSAALKKNSSLARAQALLGMAYAWKGDHELAVAEFGKAARLGWSAYDFYAWYARSLDSVGNLDQSIKYNRLALRVAPWLVDVTGRLSEQLLSKGLEDEALTLLVAFDAKQRKAGKKEYFSDRIAHLRSLRQIH